MRKDGRDVLRLSYCALTVYHPGERTGGRTNIAPVGVPRAGMVVGAAGVLGMRVWRSRFTRLMRVPPGRGLLLVNQLKFKLDAHTRGRAHHGSCQRAPKREQHRQKYEEPDAKRFHRC